jgi:hypothetical protein
MRKLLTSAVVLAAGPALGQCQFGFWGGGPAIPDLGTLRDTFFCNSYGTVGTLRLTVWVLHDRPGDLVVKLRHEASGRVATLMDRPGTEDGQSTVGYTAPNFTIEFRDDAAGPYAVPPVGAYPRPGVANIQGAFKPTVDVLLTTFEGLPLASQWTLEISDVAAGVSGSLHGRDVQFFPAEPGCYANCDHSGVAPVLNVLDFACFLDRFAGGDAYCNCDGSSSPPVLNVLDFLCFVNRYAAGCS